MCGNISKHVIKVDCLYFLLGDLMSSMDQIVDPDDAAPDSFNATYDIIKETPNIVVNVNTTPMATSTANEDVEALKIY